MASTISKREVDFMAAAAAIGRMSGAGIAGRPVLLQSAQRINS